MSHLHTTRFLSYYALSMRVEDKFISEIVLSFYILLHISIEAILHIFNHYLRCGARQGMDGWYNGNKISSPERGRGGVDTTGACLTLINHSRFWVRQIKPPCLALLTFDA